MQSELYRPHNRAGWNLDLKRFYHRRHLDRSRRPIIMVPGYCMNTHILTYHPAGVSMVDFLAEQGFEVWTANLRGQGGSRRVGGARSYGFQDLSLIDFPRVRDFVLQHTGTTATKVDAVGCSLGATVLYAYLAHNQDTHGLGAMIAIGGPLRWDRVHPLVRVMLGSPRLAGAVPVRGTRHLARAALPMIQRAPFLLSLYMNPDLIDMSAAAEFVKTIDDPNTHLTRQIAHWIRQRDLVVEGLNVSKNLGSVRVPLMCILANSDGIVPPEAALSVLEHIGTKSVEVLEVGTPQNTYAHADLFLSKDAREEVFTPLANWLTAQY